MTTPEQSAFKPTEIWTAGSEISHFTEPVQRALHEMNQKDPAQLISSLKDSVEQSEGGVTYAILKGDNPSEYSDTEALVMLNPFATAATTNMLVWTEFIREVAKYSDVRDSEGKLKPTIMLANPGLGGSKMKLEREEWRGVKNGELGPAARELLRAVSEKEFGQVALLGYSKGADMALAGARSAYSANLDTKGVAVGDPCGVEERSRPILIADMSKAGPKSVTDAIKVTGLDAQKKAFGSGTIDFMRFGLSAIRPANLALGKGLGAEVFAERVQEILDEGVVEKLVVAYGSETSIARPEKIEPAIRRLYEINGRASFMSVKVANGDHMWGNQLNLLAKLYMRAAA